MPLFLQKKTIKLKIYLYRFGTINTYILKVIEKIKLKKRANKYRSKLDIGGIAFINQSIKEGQTVFDIGAHKAGYLFWIQKLVGESGKTVAFEPQSILFEYILRIKTIFRWNNLTLEKIALSDSAGETKLYIPINKTSKKSSPEATIVKSKNNEDIGKTEIVTTQTLDAYCSSKNFKPDFLKIDVEGNELNVFKGGEKIIKENKPRILVEIESRHAGKENVLNTFKFLQSIGYAGYFIHGSVNKKLSEFTFDKYQNEKDMKNYCNNFIFEMPN